MSVYIKGMEMPEHCGKCKLKAEYDDETFCPFFTENVEYWIAIGCRHEDCPLTPVPPHGDLIDRNALLETEAFQEWQEYNSDGCFVESIGLYTSDQIADAPTIIPESEEVYDKYTYTAGDLHWTGTQTGHHIIPPDHGYSCTQAQSPFGIRTETIEVHNNRSADKESGE